MNVGPLEILIIVAVLVVGGGAAVVIALVAAARRRAGQIGRQPQQEAVGQGHEPVGEIGQGHQDPYGAQPPSYEPSQQPPDAQPRS